MRPSQPPTFPARFVRAGLILLCAPATPAPAADGHRPRVIVETDAGGDPDDEQSLVRFLLYANEWDVEGIIANRPEARDKENRNAERTGLGIVRRLVEAYGECYPRLVTHDARYARHADRTIHLFDGRIVEENVAEAV